MKEIRKEISNKVRKEESRRKRQREIVISKGKRTLREKEIWKKGAMNSEEKKIIAKNKFKVNVKSHNFCGSFWVYAVRKIIFS
jgi:uncharacterized protein YegJ (DUF2314 family)